MSDEQWHWIFGRIETVGDCIFQVPASFFASFPSVLAIRKLTLLVATNQGLAQTKAQVYQAGIVSDDETLSFDPHRLLLWAEINSKEVLKKIENLWKSKGQVIFGNSQQAEDMAKGMRIVREGE